MHQMPANAAKLRVADLPAGRDTRFALVFDSDSLAELALVIGADSLRKLSFTGSLCPEGRRDWAVQAKLGATVVQPCVVSLAPVTTRIDQPVARRFLSETPDMSRQEEIEIPEDDRSEPLGDFIDLGAILTEALMLSMPDYPRAPDAQLDEANFAPPGTKPLRDADLRPFAGLADLKKKLENGE